jgi:hypothetical protein
MSKSVIEIVNDTRAAVRSAVTTALALTVTVVGICAILIPIVPDEYADEITLVSGTAAAIGLALRQLIAWLDPKNTSFGRVRVEELDREGPQDPQGNNVSEVAYAGDQDDLVEVTDNSSRPEDGPQGISQDPSVEIASEVPDELDEER